MGKLKYSSIELEIIEQKMRFVIMQKSEEQRRKKTKSSTCIMNLCLILFMCLFCCLIFSFVMLCGSLHAFIETQKFTYTHTRHIIINAKWKRQLLLCSVCFLYLSVRIAEREEKIKWLNMLLLLFFHYFAYEYPPHTWIKTVERF
jgi:hypothetical protein